ncbi:nAChR subunit, putative, partial [Schistosoma mansoni]
LLWNSIP